MNNENYLDPDRHLWAECPDDVCFHCGYKFPADVEIEENTPMWDGFCSTQCQEDHENKKPIPCIRPMFEFLCAALGRDTVAGWSKSVYKGTDCGAWLALNGDDSISLGSIVEGSDVEIDPVYLNWPFTSDQFWGALEELDQEAAFYWERDNSIWFEVKFNPIGKPEETFFGSYCWGELKLDAPPYVVNKMKDFFDKGGDLTADRFRGVALGLSAREYDSSDMFY